MGMILIILGAILGLAATIYSILLFIKIFNVSGPLWGLASVFVPFVSIVWVVLNWEEGKRPFLKTFVFGLAAVAFSTTGAVIANG